MKIHVNGYEWSIIFTSDPSNFRIGNTIHLGVTNKDTLQVYLNNDLRGDLLRKVLVHELTHVWMYSYGYFVDRETEEILCSFVDTYAQDVIEHADEILGGNYRGYTYKTKRKFQKN